jgi:hypothetical protein
MADNLKIKDGDRITTYVKTTYDETTGVHTPHQIVETPQGSPLEVTIAGSTANGGNLGVKINNSDAIKVSLEGNSSGGTAIAVKNDTNSSLSISPANSAVFTVKPDANSTFNVSVGSTENGILRVTSSYENPILATVVTPYPGSIRKKILANGPNGNPYGVSLINWDTNAKGTFRICEANPERKYLTIYNDCDKSDLFISLANDDNPKIIIEFDKEQQINDLKVKFSYTKPTDITPTTLFEYNYSNLCNYLTRYYDKDSNLVGSNINVAFKKNAQTGVCTLTIFFTPEYFKNKLAENSAIANNSYYPYFTLSAGAGTTPINIEIPHDDIILDKTYTIFAELKNDVFTLKSKILKDITPTSWINGFKLDGITDQTSNAPEEYSSILYAKETLTVNESEAGLAYFGYLIKPKVSAPTAEQILFLRITEAV